MIRELLKEAKSSYPTCHIQSFCRYTRCCSSSPLFVFSRAGVLSADALVKALAIE